jgi:hypothetical protein
MSKEMVVASVFLVIPGCAAVSLAQISSGHVGCQPEQILISEERSDGMWIGWKGWKATCHGKVYVCSAAGHDVACHLES